MMRLEYLMFSRHYVHMNVIHAARIQNTLNRLPAAIRAVEAELARMEAEHDSLTSHIFTSRRHYRNASDTKGGKRREINARLSFNTACELGFRGSLDEWERLRDDRRRFAIGLRNHHANRLRRPSGRQVWTEITSLDSVFR